MHHIPHLVIIMDFEVIKMKNLMLLQRKKGVAGGLALGVNPLQFGWQFTGENDGTERVNGVETFSKIVLVIKLQVVVVVKEEKKFLKETARRRKREKD